MGGVGYTNLRDMSVGPLLVERLGRSAWPDGVDIEDLSAGAIHVLHALQAGPVYDAAILVAGVRRGGPPGTIRERRWLHPRQTDEAVQERVAEALVGIIDLDTLVTVLDHFGALPRDTRIIEVEPRDEDWGETLSAPVEAVQAELDRLVRRTVDEALR
ncbi:MAG: hypothetical protein H0V74_00140 [Chloroflexi bacterium]|nr:hypothetical protein [Chloroflexota bacterium]